MPNKFLTKTRRLVLVGSLLILVAVFTLGRDNQNRQVNQTLDDLHLQGQKIADAKRLLEGKGYGLNLDNQGINSSGLEDGDYSNYLGQPRWRLVPFGLKRVVIRARVVGGKVEWCHSDWESDLL